MPIRTFSPITDNTEISMSSPIMMLWFDLRVRTSNLEHPSSLPTRRPVRAPDTGLASIDTGPGERLPEFFDLPQLLPSQFAQGYVRGGVRLRPRPCMQTARRYAHQPLCAS